MNNGLAKCEGEGTKSQIQYFREFDLFVNIGVTIKPACTHTHTQGPCALIIPPNTAGTIFISHVHLQGYGAPIEICAQNGAFHA